MLTPHSPRTALLVLLGGACLHASLAVAAPVNWVAGDGAWEDAGNWSGAVPPTVADFVTIAHPVSVNSSGPANGALELLSHAALTVSAGRLDVLGTIDSHGALILVDGAHGAFGRVFVQAAGAFILDGPGTSVDVTQGVFSSGDWQLRNAALLAAESFDNFATLAIDGQALARANSMINHAGAQAAIADTGSELVIDGNLTNAGELLAAAGGTLRTVSVANTARIGVDGGHFATGSLGNSGSVEVRGAGASWNASGVVSNTGGIVLADAADAAVSTLDNAGDVTITAAGATFGELDNRAGATLALHMAAAVTVEDLALNRGLLEIDTGAALRADRFQQLDGTTMLAAGTLGAASPFGVDFAGGMLAGRGTIDGTLRIGTDGTLTPGDALAPAGRFDILGDLTLAGLFRVDLGGTAPSAFDQLLAAGAATLGGTLEVSLVNGFLPVLGDYFDIVLAASVGGDFADLLLPALPGGLRFSSILGADFYRLAVVPLPAPLLPALAALTLLVRWRRPRA